VRRLFPLTLILVAVSSQACVYYNGMYNANRLAKSARKAEHDGRTFEANGLWGQVATKAESVVVRHPTSKYAAEAHILRGVALARMGQCEQALPPLAGVATASVSTSLEEEALLAFGRCQVATGNPDAGDAAFVQLLDSKDPDHRREAQYQHARLLRQTGRYEEALHAIPDARDTRTKTERFLALAATGKLSPAMALADSLITPADSVKHWDSLVVELGGENAVAASSLVDRIQTMASRTRDAQAKLLLEDGLRLVPVDTARAAQRFRQVAALGENTAAAGRAGLELLRLDLRHVRRPEDLAPISAKLENLARQAPPMAEEIGLLSARVDEVHRAGVSITPDSVQGDLQLFLAAESARDSLVAPFLAEAMFRRIPDGFPASPYAPKAILAVQHMNPAWVDSARALLEGRYNTSPYLAMVRGETTDEYRVLEDSLGAFAQAQLVRKSATTRRRGDIPDNEREQVKRRPAPTGGTRVPEPQ
jgi:tetratricopeptide (TPR) repeat protein